MSSGDVLDVQGCVDGLFVSFSIHMNIRIWGRILHGREMLNVIDFSVSGFHVEADEVCTQACQFKKTSS